MDIVSFKEIFDPLLARHLAYKIDSYKKITSNKDVLDVLGYTKEISGGGKRLRPFIVYSIYKAKNPDSKIEEIIDLLLAIEIFHIFCLVHDDIMDEAETRHNTKTVHKHTEEILKNKNSLNTKRVSEGQAILVGDILFNTTYELLYKDGWTKDIETKNKVIQIFIELVEEVCVGQMIDINLVSKQEAPLEEIMEKTKLKTAYYSFVRPIEIAFTLTKENNFKFAKEFGENIGILFQIQDDLLDIIGKKEETNKDTLSDVLKNQHTILTDFIKNKAEEKYKKLFEEIGKMDENSIIKLFKESGAIDYAQNEAKKYIDKCIINIKEAETSEENKKIFKYITSLLQNRTK